MSKKGKKKKIFKYLKKIWLIKFLKRNWLILFLIFIAFFIILSAIFLNKNKINNENKVAIKIKEVEKNNILKKVKNKEKKFEKLKNIEKIKFFSCNDILKSGKKESWIYEIFLKNNNEKIKVYCDMETSWWGWTLIVTSQKGWWKFSDVKSFNSNIPSISSNYSILDKADFIKTVKNWKFQYRIDAKKMWENGWIWEVPEKYSFVSTSKNNTKIKLIEKYWNWKYNTFWIEKRMPYLCDKKYALLTTSINCNSRWFWTIISWTEDFSPSPWIHSSVKNPDLIWYWVK